MNNAYRMVQDEYGTFENWSGATIVTSENGQKTTTNSNAMIVYDVMIKPNIKLNKAYLENGTLNCMPEKSYSLDGELRDSMRLIKHVPTVSLASGECIGLNADTGEFFVDLNSKKGPNTLGKDQFHMAFNPYNPSRLKPDWTNSVSYCDKTSAHGWVAGMSCGYWILANQNMDYLHLSYDELKTKWKNFGW